MTKYRILIRAFTARRDVMCFKVIAKLLETYGCDVIVSSIRSFDFFIKMWKPHAILFNTQGESLNLRRKSPESKLFFVPGEGMEIGENSIPNLYNNILGQEYYQSTDLIFLWSHNSKKECKQKLKNYSEQKFIVSGNPKLDLVKFNKLNKRKSKIEQVGLSCRFPTINNHQGVPAIRALLPGKISANNLTFASMFGFNSMMNVMEKILKETDLKINLRPHPNEAVDTYFEYVLPYFKKYKKRIKINYSLCLVDWLKEIDIMLSTTSTSIYEATLLNVPIISIDKLSPSALYASKEAEQSREFLDSLDAPKSYKSLINILKNKTKLKLNTKKILNQLKNLHLWPRNNSSCLIIANEVINFLNKVNFKKKIYIPKSILEAIDEIKFKKAMKKNRLHWNFNYNEKYYKLPKDFDHIVKRILNYNN